MKKKIVYIFLIIMIMTVVFWDKPINASIGEIMKDSDEFLTKGNPVETTIDEGQLQDTSKFLFGVLLAIGIAVMMIVGTIIGIKFMIASAEEKAKVKEALIPFIVGSAVILGAFTIWSTVVKIGQKNFPTKATTSTTTSPTGGSTTHESDSGTTHGGTEGHF